MDLQGLPQENLTPKSILENFKSEDSKGKAVAVRNIGILAAEIGPDKTRKELIPYIISKYTFLINNSLLRLH